MRIFKLLFICFILFSCQKEISNGNDRIVASSFDSLVGRWQYKYDYWLVTTQADTTVFIDSVFSGHYDPFSYFQIKADSTFKWWRSESRSLPMYGGGDGGHITISESSRYIRLRSEVYTNDDFATTTPYTNPSTGPQYRIKYLSSDSLVLYFRVTGLSGTYLWWHDVYVK